jgi:hypothetical protein
LVVIAIWYLNRPSSTFTSITFKKVSSGSEKNLPTNPVLALKSPTSAHILNIPDGFNYIAKNRKIFKHKSGGIVVFEFISDYLPYFEKINIFFNIITKKVVLIYKDWSKLFVRFIRNKLNQVLKNHIKFLYSNSDYVSWLKISQVFKDWSQFLFGSWRNNLNQVVHNGLRKGVYI